MYPYPDPNSGEDWSEMADEYMKTSSGTDCTGLIPAKAQNETEIENYNELYDFLPNAVSDGRNDGC